MNKLKFILLIFSILLASSTVLAQNADKQKRLTTSDIEGKTPEELSYMRNFIFAKNGYQFSNPMYSKHFEMMFKSLNDNSKVVLSEIDNENTLFLKTTEDKLRKNREKAIEDLKSLQSKLNKNDPATIKLFYDNNIDYNSAEALSGTLNDLELDLIHYNKTCGIYKKSIDDGYSIEYKEIRITGNNIMITDNSCCHSEIFGDFDDGYSDYMSESESANVWLFDITDDGLKYQAYAPAG